MDAILYNFLVISATLAGLVVYSFLMYRGRTTAALFLCIFLASAPILLMYLKLEDVEFLRDLALVPVFVPVFLFFILGIPTAFVIQYLHKIRCAECGNWFTLRRIKHEKTTEGKRDKIISTYRCKRCGESYTKVHYPQYC